MVWSCYGVFEVRLPCTLGKLLVDEVVEGKHTAICCHPRLGGFIVILVRLGVDYNWVMRFAPALVVAPLIWVWVVHGEWSIQLVDKLLIGS